jgi:hypothetical protein
LLIDLNIHSFVADCGGGGGQPRAVPAGAGARAHHRGGGGSARNGAVPRPRFVFAVGDNQKQGWKKTRFFLKKPAQWVFFVFWVFLDIFGFFWVLLFVKKNIFAQKREEFLGFFSFKNTLRCIQTLNYNHL